MTAPPPPVDRPGEADAVFAGLNVMTGGGVSEHDRERWPEVAAIIAAAYPIIAAALADDLETLIREDTWENARHNFAIDDAKNRIASVAAARGVSE